MKKFFAYIKEKKVVIFTFLLFLFGIALVMYFMPHEKRFEYEYQQNKIWMHEDLYAPFGFSIDKTESEIQDQRDSVMKKYSPYYNYDSTVYERVADTILSRYMRELGHFVPDTVYDYDDVMKSQGLSDFAKLLKSVYSTGIVDVQKPYKTLIIERVSQRERVLAHSILTLPEAHGELMQKIPNDFDSLQRVKFKEIIFTSLIPNVLLNEEISSQLKAQLQATVSEKYGYIGKGSRIISRGSVVTEKDKKVLDSLKKEYESGNVSFEGRLAIAFGQLILLIVAFVVLFLLILYSEPDVFMRFKYSFFIVTVVVLFIGSAILTLRFEHISIYLIPYVAMPILIKNFLNARVALFVHIVTMMIIGLVAPNPFEFIFLQISVGVIALYSLGNHYQRSFLFWTALISLGSYSVIYIGLSLLKLGSLTSIEWPQLLWFLGSCVFLLTTYLLIFIFEKIFRFPSDITLFELSDTSRGVLRELSDKAPGTFQHSLQVANFVEVALRKINGNALLCRIGGLYHDIKKKKNPAFFVENQMFKENPHDNLAPEKSAQIIIDHVNYGRELSRKHGLPYSLEQIIYGHHGNSKTMFFLDKYKKLHPDEEVDESMFQYPTSKVVNKELAVIMIADGVEAASRSAHLETREQIEALVQKIVEHLINSKQLENADITLKELDIVKEVFVEKLINLYHARVPYPEDEKKDETV
ncbi:MAG: HDIG domain-containing protein [Bacteroidales bacterium]|nr:HDIG domain-containing protein [Bacteroidales bacterium]